MVEVKNSILKITKNIYINQYTFLVIIIAYLTGNINNFCTLYGIAFVHELFHFATAKLYGIQVKGLFIMPFGICLKLNDIYINETRKEIIIAAAGPFANVIMMLFAWFLKENFKLSLWDINFFIYGNLAVIMINMIPALPLDGGRILKAILVNIWGFKRAFMLMEKLTKALLLIVFLWGIYVLYLTKLNYSIILIFIFLFVNIIAEKNTSKLIIMKGITDSRKKLADKGILKAQTIVVFDSVRGSKILRNLSYNHFFIIIVVGSDMSVKGIMTEAQVVEGLARHGSNAKMEDILIGT